eukprot:scaffold320902_cov23-Tisochrysis_lutea.AAC.1
MSDTVPSTSYFTCHLLWNTLDTLPEKQALSGAAYHSRMGSPTSIFFFFRSNAARFGRSAPRSWPR